jgi:hypothetical protein
MSLLRRSAWFVVVLGLLCAGAAHAQKAAPAPPPPPSPKGHFYAAALMATTFAYRPPGGPFDGPQKDISVLFGAGYFLTDALAVELDVGPTFVESDYVAFGLVPALLWNFHPNFYAAGRLIIPVDPELNLTPLPGAGATYAFANGLAPFVELNAISTMGRGDPDFGLAVALGATYLF